MFSFISFYILVIFSHSSSMNLDITLDLGYELPKLACFSIIKHAWASSSSFLNFHVDCGASQHIYFLFTCFYPFCLNYFTIAVIRYHDQVTHTRKSILGDCILEDGSPWPSCMAAGKQADVVHKQELTVYILIHKHKVK